MLNKYLLGAIKCSLYVLVIGVPLAFFSYIVFPANLPKVILFQVVTEFAAACWLVLLALNYKVFRPKGTPVLWALAAFFAALIVSAWFGVDPLRSLWSTPGRAFGVFAYIHFGFLFLILQSVGQKLNWRKLWLVSVSVAGIVSFAAICQFFGVKLIDNQIFVQSARPGSFFGNASFMSAYLLFNFFAGLWLFTDTKIKWEKFAVMTSLVLVAGGIFAAQSIADILGLGLGFGILALFFVFRAGGRAKQLGIFAIAILLIFSGFIFATRHSSFWNKVPGFSRVSQFSFSQSDVQDRTIVWREAIQGFKDKPVLGWGWENFNIPFDRHYNPQILFVSFDSTFWDKPHNVFLEYLVTGGLVGFAAYLALLGALVYEFWVLWRRGDKEKNSWTIFLFAGFLAYTLQNATVFDTIGTYLMFALVLGFTDSEYLALRHPAAEGAEEELKKISTKEAAVFAVAMLAVIPAYAVNYNIARGAIYYYEGLDFFAYNQADNSNIAWQKSLAVKNPYSEYAGKDFASTFQQSLQNGLRLPDPAVRTTEAINALEKAISLHPQNYFYPLTLADLYNNLYTYGGQNKIFLDKADAETVKAAELSPSRQQVYYVAAHTKVLRGDINGALADFKFAVDLNPASADPHFFYGILLYQVGRTEEGKIEIETARKLGRNPNDENEAISLATLMADKAADYRGAEEYFNRAISLISDKAPTPAGENNLANTRLRLALAYYYDNNKEGAKSQFEILAKSTNIRALSIWP